MNVKLEPTCSSCAAFHRRDVANLRAPAECRLNPPSILIPTPNGDLMTVFPLTNPTHSCLQHRPKLSLVN